MEQFRRRAEDHGGDSPQTILARIDERTKFMIDKIDEHVKNFDDHKKDDSRNFAGLYKWVFIGIGVLGCLQFVVIVSKH